jgi:DNA-binding NarL/FixJ family response regulator
METRFHTGGVSAPAGIVVADRRSRVRDRLTRTIGDQADMRLVGSFETSQDTWRSLRQRRPEVLLLDWRLPDTGAMTLLRRLSPTPRINVILLTDEQRPELLAEAMILGARGVLSPGVGPDTLIRSARAVLAGELWFPRSVTSALRDLIAAKTPPGHLVPVLEEILTPRELDVAREASRGRMNKSIAHELGISPLTVRHHLKSIFEKLDVSSRLELAVLAARERL